MFETQILFTIKYFNSETKNITQLNIRGTVILCLYPEIQSFLLVIFPNCKFLLKLSSLERNITLILFLHKNKLFFQENVLLYVCNFQSTGASLITGILYKLNLKLSYLR